MNKKLIVLGAIILILAGLTVFFRYGSGGTDLLWRASGEGKILLPLISVAALIDSVNPCAFSILLLTIAFLFSIGRLRANILQIGLVYILGIFLVYMLIGLGIMKALHLFSTPHFMGRLAASVMIILGLINLIGEFFPSFPIKLKIPKFAHHKIAAIMEKASVPSAFVLGGLVGLCEFPCTGGPYLMVLGLLHDKATYLSGLGYLLIYNLIFVLPLVLILLVAANKDLLEKAKEWQVKERRVMKIGGSIAVILLGLFVLSL